ncbi:hypothetical protein Rsub_10135 [Raphidocelis subcapitata]|uniref:Protein BCCIP homolog n=1 Tax=Raphidocelis subcapitata TaxID=307507 RepID=A0A2V0PB82_9CHLO|nr:hypothetical protein Rsub_10135 [Raphidocelis subcapitata]|eukprot:GBF97124.1 hypothetical protein Rsub_10135 [Raphidocelis subcapitata]
MAKKRRAAEAAVPEPEKQEKEAEEPSGSDGGEASGGPEGASSGEPSDGSGSGDGSDSGSDGSSGSDDGEDSSDDGSSAPEVSDDDEAQSEDDEDGAAFDEVNVDFQFFDPKEIDFHGLKALLHTYLDGGVYDGSGLAEAIIAQSSVGTVVKTGEDDDPIAVMTALNTRSHGAASFAKQVKEFLLGKAPDEAARKQFAEAWDAEGTALMINERLINAPPQLAPPLMQALFDEIAWATEDEPSEEARRAFKLKRFVLITRAYTDPTADGGGGGGGGGSAGPSGSGGERKKKKAKAAAAPLLVYVRPEDEFLHAQAAASFTWRVEGRPVAKDELVPMRLALLFTSEAAARARRELDRVVGNAAGMAPPPAMGALGGGKGKGKGKAAGKK